MSWPGSRVLLTGQADEQVAVRAFNRGLIDQFIAKQTPDISRRLIDGRGTPAGHAERAARSRLAGHPHARAERAAAIAAVARGARA